MGRVAQRFQAARQSQATLASKEDLYKILATYVESVMFDEIEAEELVKEDIVKVSPRGRPKEITADYELRYVELGFSELGLLGKVDREQLRATINHRFEHAFKRLSLEQPSCNWQVVACEVIEKDLNRLWQVGAGREFAPNFASAQSLFDRAQSSGQTLSDGSGTFGIVDGTHDQVRQHVLAADHKAMVCMAIADVAQGELRDPWEGDREYTGRLAKYVDDGNIKSLPTPLRKERALAKELILRAVESQHELEEAEARQRHVQSMIAELDGGELPRKAIDQTMIEAAVVLRIHGRQKWTTIADTFGVSWQALSAACKKEVGADALRLSEDIDDE